MISGADRLTHDLRLTVRYPGAQAVRVAPRPEYPPPRFPPRNEKDKGNGEEIAPQEKKKKITLNVASPFFDVQANNRSERQ